MSVYLHTPSPARRPTPVGRNRPLAEVQEEQVRRKRKRGPKVGGISLSPRLRNLLLYPLLAIGAVMAVMAANNYVDTLPLRDIDLTLHTHAENAFLDMADVRELLMGEGYQPLLGVPMAELDLAMLEERLRQSPYVQTAEVSKSLLGVLRVELTLRTAVARLINNSGSHLYLDASGHKFPTSQRHTAYVPLVRGDFEEAVVDTFACSSLDELLPLLNFLQTNPFWQAQVAEILVAQDGQIRLQPEVGDMDIEFGYPVRIEEKFSHLMDFYKQVVPEVGWKKYRSLSVKYRGQVIARR